MLTVADHYLATKEADSCDDMLTLLKRRRLQRHACLISVIAAFCLGLMLGIVAPLFGHYDEVVSITEAVPVSTSLHIVNRSHAMPHFPTIDDIRESVSFVQVNNDEIVPGSYKRLQNDLWIRNRHKAVATPSRDGVLSEDIFWGPLVENSMPTGFTKADTGSWLNFLNSSEIVKLEQGCGRMQNRLVHFRDGSMACARYRQNTDQIQGELFSFYLGQLINLTNLAPSTVIALDQNSHFWNSAAEDITEAQWKNGRPIVFTRWIPSLEATGIPKQFRPKEKHLNKFDVQKLPTSRLVELAQWSDLIIFDYLIANLDRVVNNLYNQKWNADIMEAPAHNLAKQVNSNLLVFLDNESGLLHGYRLLKKYETYHSLLLENLCVFRKSTIAALQQLQARHTVGSQMNAIFELTTSREVRDVLPPLPEKSVKTLVKRIDRVLDQVQKCRDTFATASTATAAAATR